MALSNTVCCLRQFSNQLLNHSCSHTGNILRNPVLVLPIQSLLIKRHYRGRKSHNIGRMHGLEKAKPSTQSKKHQGIWQPNLHQASKPNAYDSLNFTVEGFDLVLVESFSKYIHQLMIKYKQNIKEVYALPSNDVEIREMHAAEQRTVADMPINITLTSHKRVVQVIDMPSNLLSIILQTLLFCVPQSVTFTVKKHDEEQHRLRFQRRLELEKERELLKKLQSSR